MCAHGLLLCFSFHEFFLGETGSITMCAYGLLLCLSFHEFFLGETGSIIMCAYGLLLCLSFHEFFLGETGSITVCTWSSTVSFIPRVLPRGNWVNNCVDMVFYCVFHSTSSS